ncbi:uncharacterized protein LOC134537585 [Bacillus rossius redtenbacheri]|uniref:uncharacterized protein LOC134537585 n=1 Tax=Bacillus rossius redtenbacheri TaxID=93214 RepID=UPI002FDD99E9
MPKKPDPKEVEVICIKEGDSSDEMPADEASEKPEEGEKAKEDAKSKENGEGPAGKKALLRPVVISLKAIVDQLMEMTDPDLDAEQKDANVCTKARKIKQLADDLISLALRKTQTKSPAEYQYVTKVQGLRPQHFKDMRNLLQNVVGLGMVKISTGARNSPFVDINFLSKECMEKGLEIIRDKPLGLSLSVIETKMVDKSRLPPECVLSPLDKDLDTTTMLKESLLRTRELTEEECRRLVEWKDKFVRHSLAKMCESMDPDIHTIVKDRTEGYFYKLEKIRATIPPETASERYQTYSGVNPETGKLEMGYWVLGSDVPSRYPRSPCIKRTLKVFTEFMESSGKPLYDLRVRKGYWHSIMFRSNHVDECMVVLLLRTGNNADTEKDLEALKPQLKELVETGPGKDCGVKSIHVKTISESGRSGSCHLVHGEEHLDDEVAGVKLRLYLASLFWTDCGSTELVCSALAGELGLGPGTGVLQLGVATALICMYLAQRCKVVCALDRMQTVIPLAKENVERNGLKNVVLVQGSPATTLTSLRTHFKECESVHAVVLETSSNSRNKEEILSLRKSLWIKKVAYMIISYKDVTTSLRLLCSKNTDTSEPFVIVKVIPFDVTSTSFRPDVLLMLERPSVLEGLTEKRVPATKPVSRPDVARPKAGLLAKRPRLSNEMSPSGLRPRALLSGPSVRPPLMREPLLPSSRGYMDRGFGPNPERNIGYGSQRGPSMDWSQGGNVRRTLLPFDNESARIRAAEEEEEVLLLERSRQKESQLQQLQDVVMQAQRRRVADGLLPTPQVAPVISNIEEVVLTAIKKTGLLEKVAALTEAPRSSRVDLECTRRDPDDWSRYKEAESSDRWPSSYHQRGADARTSINESRYESQDSLGYRDRGSYGYSNRDESPEPLAQGSFRYQSRDVYDYDDGDTTRKVPAYKPRGGYYD